MDLGIAKFRIAKFSHCEFGFARFSHCEIGIGSVNSKLALRNGIWHCEMAFGVAKFRIAKFSHCEIKIGIAKSILALRNGIWHCEISHCEIFALRIWVGEFSHCEMGLRNFRIAKWVCEQFAKISFFADFPCLSSSLQLHLIIFTFPSIFH